MKYNYPLSPKDVWKDNPFFKTVPEYTGLSAKQMCFVMLVGDPASPHIGKYFKEDGEQELFRSACVGLGFSDRHGNLTDEGEKMVFGDSMELQAAIQHMRDSTGFDLVKGVGATQGILKTLIDFTKMEIDRTGDAKENKAIVSELRALVKDNIISTAMAEVQKARALLGMQKERKDDEDGQSQQLPSAD